MTPAAIPDLLATAYGPDALVAYTFARRPQDGFYSGGVDCTDDLASALTLTLSPGGVHTTCDGRTITPAIWRLLTEDLGVALCDRSRVHAFPAGLTSALGAAGWCEGLLEHLRALSGPGQLIMAQPFDDPRLEHRFRIPPRLSLALNDKIQLPKLLPAAAPPLRHGLYATGADAQSAAWPGERCILKVSASCAGEGVWPCADEAAFLDAKAAVASIPQPVLIERWIDVVRNLDVELLVPADPNQAPSLLGVVEQVVGPDQRLAGGVCNPPAPCEQIPALTEWVLGTIAPALRDLGWFGVGGFDVLVDRQGRSHVIDPNLRLTDFTAPLMRSRRCPAGQSLLILPYATFDGDLAAFRQRLAPLAREGAPDQVLTVLGLLDEGAQVRVHGGLLFTGPDQLRSRAAQLRRLGLDQRALDLVETVAASACLGARG